MVQVLIFAVPMAIVAMVMYRRCTSRGEVEAFLAVAALSTARTWFEVASFSSHAVSRAWMTTAASLSPPISQRAAAACRRVHS